jgi:hypothetical protein
MGKFFTSIIIILVLGIVVGGGVFFASTNGFNFAKEDKVDISAVLTEIKQISQINTTEMYFNEIVQFSEAISFVGFTVPFTEKKFIFTVKAKVQSGIDLSTLSEDDILIEDKKVTLTLDRAKITSKEVIEYKAYSEKDGLFNNVSTDDTLKQLNEFNARLEQQALESGILEKAEENAKIVLSGFLKLLKFEEIVINFK